MATIKSEFDDIQKARSQLAEALITKFGVRRYDNAKDNPTLKGLWTVNADGSAKQLKRLRDWALLVTGTNVRTDGSLTFKSDGKGDAAGTSFNGSENKSISYNSIGAAPALTGNQWAVTTPLNGISVAITNSGWIDACTINGYDTGTYALQITETDSVSSGVFSIFKGQSDNEADEIILHTANKASTSYHIFARTNAGKLQVACTATGNKTLTIKIKRLI